MEWSSLSSILFVVIAIAGTIIALRQRKKSEPQKQEDTYRHFKGLGLQVSLAGRDEQKEKGDIGRGTGQKSEGLIALENSNIAFINTISVATQYGVNYFLNYLVESPKLEDKKQGGKVKLKKKKEGLFAGKVISIEWKGMSSLAQRLNFNYRLEDMLLVNSFKGSIDIIPEPKWRYMRIQTQYFLPTSDLFRAIELIARDIRLEYSQRRPMGEAAKDLQRNR